MVRFSEPVLRGVVYHRILSLALLLLFFLSTTATCVVALMFLDGVVWRGPAGLGLVSGAVILAGGVWWAIARLDEPGSGEDPITSPYGDAGISSDGRARARTRHASLLVTFPYTAMIPGATVLMLATNLMIHQMSPR
jgi:hypothetical protein